MPSRERFKMSDNENILTCEINRREYIKRETSYKNVNKVNHLNNV